MPWAHTKSLIFKFGLWPPSTWVNGWGQWGEPERVFRSEASNKGGEKCFLMQAGGRLKCQAIDPTADKSACIFHRNHGGYKLAASRRKICCQDPADGQFELFMSAEVGDDVALFAEAPALSGSKNAVTLVTTIRGNVYYLRRKGGRVFLFNRKLYKSEVEGKKHTAMLIKRQCSWLNVHGDYFEHHGAFEGFAGTETELMLERLSFVFDDGFADLAVCGLAMTDDHTGHEHFLSSRFAAVYATARPMINAAVLGMALASSPQTTVLVLLYVVEIIIYVATQPETGAMANVRTLWELLWQLTVIIFAEQAAALQAQKDAGEATADDVADKAQTMMLVMFVGVFGEVAYQLFSIALTFAPLLNPKELAAQVVVDSYTSLTDGEVAGGSEAGGGVAGGGEAEEGAERKGGEEEEDEEEGPRYGNDDGVAQADEEMEGAVEEWIEEGEEEEEEDEGDEDEDLIFQVIAAGGGVVCLQAALLYMNLFL